MSVPANPLLPCHECGTEERFMTMKRSDEWTLEYLDDDSGEWVAFCSDCSPRNNRSEDTDMDR